MDSTGTYRGLPSRQTESGNVIFFVLLAILLIGLVTAALRSSTEGQNDIDRETLVIKASQIRQYASELERGIAFIRRDGVSENDIRFASTATDPYYGDVTASPTNQIFSEQGGGVTYQDPLPEISSAGHWEFYGNTAFAGVGTSKPDLAAVLPDVTKDFCDYINGVNSQNLVAPGPPAEDGDCAIDDTAQRFTSATLYKDGGPNTVDNASFTAQPAMEACVACTTPTRYIFYHVLIAR